MYVVLVYWYKNTVSVYLDTHTIANSRDFDVRENRSKKLNKLQFCLSQILHQQNEK